MSEPWANNILSFEPDVDPTQLLAHPLNARRHPGAQRDALRESLGRAGWVDVVKVNTRTGHVVDGHARVEEAITAGAHVPVLYLDLSEEDERFVLATLDPISALATYDGEVLEQLMDGIDIKSRDLLDMLNQIESVHLYDDDEKAGLDGATLTPGDAAYIKPPSLADRFVVPPFSVFDARQGYWQDRKRQWLSIGILSELGRPHNLTYGDIPKVYENSADGKPKAPNKSIPQAHGGNDPQYYHKKQEVERKLGRQISNAVFEQDFYINENFTKTSIFDPVLCEVAYRYWCPPTGTVLDPFAGGSVRGIVASRLGLSYTGCELRDEQCDANRLQAKDLCKDGPLPVWIEGDSGATIPLLDAPDFDFVFSCPPYGDLETYSDDPADLSTMDWPDFLDQYRHIIKSSIDSLKDDRFACFVVGEIRGKDGFYRGLVPETIAAFTDAGAGLYNEGVLITAVGSLALRAAKTFTPNRKLAKAHQNVLVFCKGNPSAAAASLGDLILPDASELFDITEDDLG
jgi:hypothetical protein